MKIEIEIDETNLLADASRACRYWARFDYESEDGGIVIVLEHGDERVTDQTPRYDLTWDGVRRALGMMAEPRYRVRHQLAKIVAGLGDDASTDVLVQLAVLGEVRYG